MLTEAGNTYYEDSVRALALIESSESRLQDDDLAIKGRLRVTAPSGLLSKGEPPILVSFRNKFPGVDFDVDVSNRNVDLLEDRIDVAVRITRPKDSSLIARRVVTVDHVLVASPRYLEARGIPDTPEMLTEQQCILDRNYSFDPNWPFTMAGREFEVTVDGPIRVNEAFLSRNLAIADQGIALSPRVLVQREIAMGLLVEVLPGTINFSSSVYAVTSHRSRLPARTRAFIEHLKEVLPAIFQAKPKAI